jgi:hypothetical protein
MWPSLNDDNQGLLNPPLCRVCGGTGRKPQLRTEDATIPRRAYADVADLD